MDVFAYSSIFEISIKHVPKDDFPLPNIDLLVDKTVVKICLLYYYYYDLPTIRNFHRRLPRVRVRFVREAPLGFYGAWPVFALTHHLVIWFLPAQVYPGVPFTRYAILGDDIVIGDERVAERYRELMSQLNILFSLEKSLVSSVGALEFAKRFFVRGVTKDLSPVSCRMLRSLIHIPCSCNEGHYVYGSSITVSFTGSWVPGVYSLHGASWETLASTFPCVSLTERCVSSPFFDLVKRNHW